MSSQSLRQTREARGLAIEEVASLARIPERYLRALEEDDLGTLPPGPFHRGYQRQYLAFLGLSEASTTLDEGPTEQIMPVPLPPTGSVGEPVLDHQLPVREDETMDLAPQEVFEDPTLTIPRHEEVPIVRLVVTGFIITFAVLLGLRLGATVVDQGLEQLDQAEQLAAAEAASDAALGGVQQVRVRTVEPVKVRVEVDGKITKDGRLPAGESIDVEGHDVRIWISDLSVVTVHANGERVEPLHNLTASRTLRFVYDGS